jgi:multiple sugar transport system permease protein
VTFVMRAFGRHAPALVVAAVFLLPLVVMVTGSLRPVGVPPASGLELIPRHATLESYARLAELVPLWAWLANSAVVVAVAVPVTVVVASWAAFGIRLLSRRTRRVAIVALVALLFVPATALWATRFEVYRALGVLDTLIPLMAPALAASTPFFVLIFVWSFTGLPDSQLAAARLEGASVWQLWRRVVMPQARPATLAVAVLAFGAFWSNFLDPLLYIHNQAAYTLPLGLRLLQLLNPTEWPLMAAAIVVATLPAIAVFLLAHRLFLDDPLTDLRRSR